MSDRFYQQMADHFNISPWELIIALRDENSTQRKSIERKCMTKVTRPQLNSELKELLGKDLGLGKATLNTLTVILEKFKRGKLIAVEMPEGRLKAPYYDAVNQALGVSSPLDLSTLTVVVLKGLLEAINEKATNPI